MGIKNTDYKETIVKILELSDDTAPIVLSFGFVGRNGLPEQGIVIKKAPPIVTRKMIEDGYNLNICEDGIHIGY